MKNKNIKNDYKYGFKDDYEGIRRTKRGLTKDTILEISSIKNEPSWMLDFRMQSYENFLKAKDPNWGPVLNKYINFDEYTYYIKPSDKSEQSWDDVPEKIKSTFEKIGIPQAEKEFLAGVSTQYESEVVYHSVIKELEEQGVIFTDTDTALKEYPKLFKKYFSRVVPNVDNKYAALNSAVWSGGSFIYVPKGVKIEKPLQSYFRINSSSMGQFERTLIIVDEGAEVHYIEGCTAPNYQKDSLHAAVVELWICKGAKARYTTIQNWSDNVINLVTKRAYVEENGSMEWIDGNIGALVNMKYPCCILAGKGASGYTLSIAVASSSKTVQDTGAKMVHLAPNTKSRIVSKSLAFNGGQADYRGMVHIAKNATGSISNIDCDTLLIDSESKSQTIPWNKNFCSDAVIEHEAKISKLSDEDIFYFENRGISREEAVKMITLGFLEPFSKELPMEYAVELNQLIKMDMEGSIG